MNTCKPHFTKIDQEKRITEQFAFGTPWLPDLLCKHWFTSSVWNFCRWIADVPPRETPPAARSKEKRLFLQATWWHHILTCFDYASFCVALGHEILQYLSKIRFCLRTTISAIFLHYALLEICLTTIGKILVLYYCRASDKTVWLIRKKKKKKKKE